MNEQLLAYDRELEQLARGSETARRLMTIPGIGAVTASAMLASVGDPRQFQSGRAFAAWLGLVPRQYTTGGKIRLGRITKRGDVYLRTLLIHGTRAVLAKVKDKPDRLSAWSRALIERRGYKRAAVALAAKNARILWALMRRGTAYQLKPLV
jgi:transposase